MCGGHDKRASWHAFSLLTSLKEQRTSFHYSCSNTWYSSSNFLFLLASSEQGSHHERTAVALELKVRITGLGLILRHLTLAKGRATPDRGLWVTERIFTVTHTFTRVILVNLHTQGLFPGWVKAIPFFFPLLSLLYFICTPKIWVHSPPPFHVREHTIKHHLPNHPPPSILHTHAHTLPHTQVPPPLQEKYP